MSSPDTTMIRGVSVESFVVAMVSRLRELGLTVPPDATIAFAAALAEVGVGRRASVYWAGRATLVNRPEDISIYDDVFSSTFDVAPDLRDFGFEGEPSVTSVTLAVDDPDLGPGHDAGGERVVLPDAELRWADSEVLRTRDFAACSAEELEEVHRLVAELSVSPALRPSRRYRSTRRTRGPLDLRAMGRRSVRTGGEALRTSHRSPGKRARRLVLLCDVSGSMEVYSRALVRFAHAAVMSRGPVEVFTLGTRCTRITRSLRTHDADAALAAASASVEDWSSGTRLGEGLRVFNDTWGQRGMARGAVVVVLSDGWDRGDPNLLAEQVARLQRAAHRLVWVNPLKATPEFAPIAQGMAAALPFVDDFVEGHSFASLEALAEVIARSPERRGAGSR